MNVSHHTGMWGSERLRRLSETFLLPLLLGVVSWRITVSYPVGPLCRIPEDHCFVSWRITVSYPGGPLFRILEKHCVVSCRTTVSYPGGLLFRILEDHCLGVPSRLFLIMSTLLIRDPSNFAAEYVRWHHKTVFLNRGSAELSFRTSAGNHGINT
jgi:hypothetical protein